jgi:hypothetical protein
MNRAVAQSWRSATVGSRIIARRAGKKQEASAANTKADSTVA